ncbi:hypothetical protein ANN_23901 [Periplaneta americana]|uniref:Secreted protein n=1 Tax=Periplaneta americana TaxID=6978 RepID=A0ABQ8S1T0_PERAM|nr:hypothetical protein ANN_23901 [Periplaneta americana]
MLWTGEERAYAVVSFLAYFFLSLTKYVHVTPFPHHLNTQIQHSVRATKFRNLSVTEDRCLIRNKKSIKIKVSEWIK